ncbi:MAG: AEC family transporter [Clostridia bacterium]|nr:AEC family transporter [Clostridia bacterium]
MIDILGFSFEAVMPILLLMVIGFFLKHIGLIDANMLDKSNKLVFRLFLPARIFSDVYQLDLIREFDLKLMLYAACGVMASILLMLAIVPRFVRQNGKRGSIIQAVYRSNYVIYAIPLATNMFGDAGLAPTTMLLPVVMILFNVIGVIILSAFSDKRDPDQSIRQQIVRTLADIARNPLILGSVAGMVFSLLRIPLPAFLDKAVSQIGGIGSPFALLLLGAQFDWSRAKGNLRIATIVSLVRLVVMPTILLSVCILVGRFQGAQLGALFSLFCTPTAVNSYVMAKNMHNDADLAGQLVIMTTLLSGFTIFAGIALLRGLGLF